MVQSQRKTWHNKLIKEKKFKTSDWALLFKSRFMEFKGKLQKHWLGPYQMETIFDNASVKLRIIDEDRYPIMANAHKLKLYNKPLSKEDFTTKAIRIEKSCHGGTCFHKADLIPT